MDMTAEEIVRHYQQAKNKSADIKILAELNTTDTASIRAILIDAGVLAPDKDAKKPITPPKSNSELAVSIITCLKSGLSKSETARQLQCSQVTVTKYAKQLEKAAGAAPAQAAPPDEAPPAPLAQHKSPGNVVRRARKEIYERVESIIDSLPEDADPFTRGLALDLCLQLLRRDLRKRLEVQYEQRDSE